MDVFEVFFGVVGHKDGFFELGLPRQHLIWMAGGLAKIFQMYPDLSRRHRRAGVEVLYLECADDVLQGLDVGRADL